MDRCLRGYPTNIAAPAARAMRAVRFYPSSFLPITIKRVLLLLMLSITSTASPSEILIARGDESISAQWCGASNTLIVVGKTSGVRKVDFLNNKSALVQQSGDNYPMGCSPDGRWVLYVDRKSSRSDADYVPTEDSAWDGGVVDLYRYDTVIGTTQRFAVIRLVGPYTVMPPSAFKVFLGAKHNSSIKMPEPMWEVFWSRGDMGGLDTRWLRDGTGVIDVGVGDEIWVEFFGKKGWNKRFKTKLGNISSARTDDAGRIYVLAEPDDRAVEKRRFLHRCEIQKGRSLACKKLLGQKVYITSYAVLPNGDILFTEKGDNCIRRTTSKHNNTICVAKNNGSSMFYINEVSHDGNWLAFTRASLEKVPPGIYQITHSDVFVVKLTRE